MERKDLEMEINRKVEDSMVTLEISGRLEAVTAPRLEAEFSSLAADVKNLTLDFTDLEYVSSAGLRAILVAQRMMNAREGTMVLKGVNASVMNILQITGFAPILKFV